MSPETYPSLQCFHPQQGSLSNMRRPVLSIHCNPRTYHYTDRRDHKSRHIQWGVGKESISFTTQARLFIYAEQIDHTPESHMTCRICLEPCDEDAPCLCTCKIHDACLMEWRKRSPTPYQCEICKTRYDADERIVVIVIISMLTCLVSLPWVLAFAGRQFI